MKLLITGGAGYIGAMLADQFSRREDVESILLIDREPFPRSLNDHPKKEKFSFIQDDLAHDTWQEEARRFSPDVVIHTAWQIREAYGGKKDKGKTSVYATDKVFDFVFSTPRIKQLIHFSTVASYGAFPENTISHFFTEEDPFRKSEYSYAEEKRIVEEHLVAKNKGNIQVVIVRPASITGPRGRSRSNFGLQSALSGKLKKEKSFLYKVISYWVSLVPVTPKWARQYIHEDDVNDIVSLLTFGELKNDFEIFNIVPPGPLMLGKDMADAVNKKTLPIYPWMVRLAFFAVWHLTRGRIPTSPGSWKGYSYPIVVDGTKITRMYGYDYKYPSKEAFVKNLGRYAILGTT